MRSKKSVGEAGAGAECMAGGMPSFGMRSKESVDVRPRRSASGTTAVVVIIVEVEVEVEEEAGSTEDLSSVPAAGGVMVVSTAGRIGVNERRGISEETFLEDKDGR